MAEENKRLRVEVATLKSYARIEKIATEELGMSKPRPDQVIDHPMKRKPINWFKVRIFFLSCLLFFCFALVIGRMFQLQVLKKEQLYQMAAQQQHAQIPLVPKRGTISDRKGNELAVSIEVDSVYADPEKVTDPEKTAQSLGLILQIDPEELKGRLKSRGSFEWIQRKIAPKEAEEIKAQRLPGHLFSEGE